MRTGWIERLRGGRPWRLRLLTLAVAERCDQKCAHCSIWLGPGPEYRALTSAERFAVVEQALAAGIDEALLTGGEPLLSADLFPICERLKAAGVRISLATNGMLLARYAEPLARCIDEVYVSLDGATASTHDGLRGVAAFERVRAGLMALRQAAPGLRQTVRSTLHAGNLHEFEGVVAAAADMGADAVSFLPLDASSDAFGGDPAARAGLVPDLAQVQAFEAAVGRLEAAGRLDGFVLESGPKLRRLARHLRASAGALPFERPACDAPWWSLVVEADGRLRPCFFHEAVGDVRQGLVPLRGSPAYRAALEHVLGDNRPCERCVCPKLRGPAWLKRVGLGS